MSGRKCFHLMMTVLACLLFQWAPVSMVYAMHADASVTLPHTHMDRMVMPSSGTAASDNGIGKCCSSHHNITCDVVGLPSQHILYVVRHSHSEAWYSSSLEPPSAFVMSLLRPPIL